MVRHFRDLAQTQAIGLDALGRFGGARVREARWPALPEWSA